MIDENQLTPGQTPEEKPADDAASAKAAEGQPEQEATESKQAPEVTAEGETPETVTEETPETVEESPVATAPDTPEETAAVEAAAVETAAMEDAEVAPEEQASVVAEEVSAVETPPEEAVADVVTASAEPAEHAEEELTEHTDYSSLSKGELIPLLENALQSVRDGAPELKAIDLLLREVKPVVDHLKIAERQEALQKFIAEGGDEEGFSFKGDAQTQKLDQLFGQIRSERNKQFQQAEKAREDNFARKTELLNKLRELVENEEKSGAGEKSWDTFKQIQGDWKTAGNIPSAHNNTLWQTYHALVDRYFNNRNIYFELKELDRKRNMQQKIEMIERVEKTVATVTGGEAVSGKMLDDANELFEEFKHIGPAPREVNEELWRRFKTALDVLYGKKREQNETQRGQAEEIFKLKQEIAALAETFTTFHSSSINEWNDKTKALLTVQDQWNAVKGPLPREKGREISQKFWGDIKTFFRNKGEFFRQLEAKREENLKQKTALCEQAENLLGSGDDSSEATNTVIELQRRWKSIGHVPEKMRDKIFERFKAACDAFFDRKRNKNAGVEREYEENLAKKKALCDEIEGEAKAGEPDLEKLNAFKARWSGIGFVPRKEMQTIQQRYIKAVNTFVSAMGKLSAHEKEQIVLESEVEMVKNEKGRGGNVDLRGRENDIRRKIRTLEDEIAQLENNLAFFARSKNADKIKDDFEKRIEKSKKELEQLQHQLRVVREAEDQD